MERVKVAVLGGSGYTALELLNILLRHPHAAVAAVTSRQAEPVTQLHPSLLGRTTLVCEPFDPAGLAARGVQAAFACLPHGASAEAVGPLLARGIRVIDLSADYRLKDAGQYKQWYGADHPDPANLSHAVYGLPELFGDELPAARLIANPGCYPQTAILALAPLLTAGLIDPHDIVIDSKSGVSGAGRTPKLATHFPECNESVSAYAVGTHRHTPEIEQALGRVAGRPVTVLFTPHLMPMDRGIFSTVYARPKRPVTGAELLELFQTFYDGKSFVRVRADLPATKDTARTNFLDVAPKAVGGRLVVLAAEDNLVRGASGVAVQNFNRAFGFAETTGLL